MSVLLDSLARASTSDAQDRAALDAILRDGLPGARSEAWKYTSLRALERRSFAPADTVAAAFDGALLASIPAPRLVFVNGRFAQAHSHVAGLPAGVVLQCAGTLPARTPDDTRTDKRSDDVFVRLNGALAGSGVVLRLAAGVTLAPAVHLVFIGAPAAADLAWHLRHRIELGDGASATVVEHHLHDGDHAHLGNERLHVVVGADATLHHARVQAQAPRATAFARTDALLTQRACYRRLDLELGAALSRHELNVRLEGEGAQLVANGVLLADGRRHLDTRLGIAHIARDTRCDLLWRGIGAGRGRAVFHGGIDIHAGADGSDATLSNKNLLLGENAEIDTQPVLVIHADEVKAAHGATVGQLDPTAMFYLRSRGLSETDARRLLTSAFVREPLAAIASPELRALLQVPLDHALQRLAAQ